LGLKAWSRVHEERLRFLSGRSLSTLFRRLQSRRLTRLMDFNIEELAAGGATRLAEEMRG
jgi:hypothetical protein